MKKMTAWLLALLMMAMPFAGLAESETAVPPVVQDIIAALSAEETDVYGDAIAAGRRVTTKVTVGNVASDFTGDAAVDQVIADVLNALNIEVYQQGDETYFAIGMKQASGEVADLLNLGVAVAGDDAYIASNLVGGTIVVGAEEVVPVLQRLIDMLVMIGFVEEAEAEEIKAMLPELVEMYKAEYAAAMESAAAVASLDYMKMDYSAITEGLTMLISKLGVNTVDMQPKNCDTAVSAITLTLAPAEVNELIAMVFQFMKDNPDFADVVAAEMDYENTLAVEFSGVAGETLTFAEFLDKMIEEIKTAEIFGGDVTCRILLGEDGMPVSMELVAPVIVNVANPNSEDDTVETTVQNITVSYARLTLNDGTAHTIVAAADDVDMTVNVLVKDKNVNVSFAAAEAGVTVLDVKVDVTDRSAENLNASDMLIDMTIYEDAEAEPINVKLAITADTAQNGVDFTDKTAMTISVNGKEYATVNIEGSTGDAGASIMTGNVVRPAELNDTDFANWFVGVYNSLFTWVSAAMYALPASVMNLMNTGY